MEFFYIQRELASEKVHPFRREKKVGLWICGGKIKMFFPDSFNFFQRKRKIG